MAECPHNESVYDWNGKTFGRSCSCGLKTSSDHASAEKAHKAWVKASRPFMDAEAVRNRVEAVMLKKSVGEALTDRNEIVLAYGQAPKCHHP